MMVLEGWGLGLGSCFDQNLVVTICIYFIFLETLPCNGPKIDRNDICKRHVCQKSGRFSVSLAGIYGFVSPASFTTPKRWRHLLR